MWTRSFRRYSPQHRGAVSCSCCQPGCPAAVRPLPQSLGTSFSSISCWISFLHGFTSSPAPLRISPGWESCLILLRIIPWKCQAQEGLVLGIKNSLYAGNRQRGTVKSQRLVNGKMESVGEGSPEPHILSSPISYVHT